MLWRPNNNDLLIGIKNDSVHDWLAFEEKNRHENEAKRLLYVACTRAENSLCLVRRRAASVHKALQGICLSHQVMFSQPQR